MEAALMSICRRMDKEDAYIYTQWNLTQLLKKRKKSICSNMPELEIILLSEASQSEKDK